MIALVTTVMAFVYPNITKLYENYVNKTRYYDQTQDIYTLRAVYEYLTNTSNVINNITENGSETITSLSEGGIISDGRINNNVNIGNLEDILNEDILNLEELYILSYTEAPTADNYDFTRYLKRMKIKTYDPFSYRLVGVFKQKDEDGNIIETRYASIKIDDPSPY